MKELKNWKVYEQCPKYQLWLNGLTDKCCLHFETQTSAIGKSATVISDYAKSRLVHFLKHERELAMQIDLWDVPAVTDNDICTKERVLDDTFATCSVLAENWQEVKTVLDDWYNETGYERNWFNPEYLHFRCVHFYSEAAWRIIFPLMVENERLTEVTLNYALKHLKSSDQRICISMRSELLAQKTAYQIAAEALQKEQPQPVTHELSQSRGNNFGYVKYFPDQDKIVIVIGTKEVCVAGEQGIMLFNALKAIYG